MEAPLDGGMAGQSTHIIKRLCPREITIYASDERQQTRNGSWGRETK